MLRFNKIYAESCSLIVAYVRTYVRVLILEDGGGGRGGREGEHVPGRAALEIKRTLLLAHVISGHGRS